MSDYYDPDNGDYSLGSASSLERDEKDSIYNGASSSYVPILDIGTGNHFSLQNNIADNTSSNGSSASSFIQQRQQSTPPPPPMLMMESVNSSPLSPQITQQPLTASQSEAIANEVLTTNRIPNHDDKKDIDVDFSKQEEEGNVSNKQSPEKIEVDEAKPPLSLTAAMAAKITPSPLLSGTIIDKKEITDSLRGTPMKITEAPTDEIDHSKTDEKMDVDVISVPAHSSESLPVSSVINKHVMSSLPKKGSHSAPSSPTRPKMFRSTSMHGHHRHHHQTATGAGQGDERGHQDLETASILVGMSQTKMDLKNGSKGDLYSRSSTNSPYVSSPQRGGQQKPAVLCVPQGYSIVGRVGGASLPGQPMRIFNPQNMPPGAHHQFSQHSRRGASGIAVKQSIPADHSNKSMPPRSPQPAPPDSPDSTRREFQDPPKREFPRDDKTRRFLQEKINRERDKCRGKRSIPFHEELDDYKSNTRKAAKRALFGPNPFNIGVHLPDNFLLRADKRTYQAAAPSVNAGVMKFFSNALENKPRPEDSKFLKNGKSPPSTSEAASSTPYDPYITQADLIAARSQLNHPAASPSQHNPALDPYKTSEDIRKYRESALLQQQQQQQPKEKSQGPELQNVLQGLKDLHAHSPKDVSATTAYEEGHLSNNNNNNSSSRIPDRRLFERADTSSTALTSVTTTTTNVFVHPAHGLSSIFVPVQGFPYGHPTNPSQSPYMLPPGASQVKKGGPAQAFPPSFILPIQTDRQRLPINPGAASPYVQFHPNTVPPNLHRFETSRPIFRGEPAGAIRIPISAIDSPYKQVHQIGGDPSRYLSQHAILSVRPTAPPPGGGIGGYFKQSQQPYAPLRNKTPLSSINTEIMPKINSIISYGPLKDSSSYTTHQQQSLFRMNSSPVKQQPKHEQIPPPVLPTVATAAVAPSMDVVDTVVKEEIEDVGYPSSSSSSFVSSSSSSSAYTHPSSITSTPTSSKMSNMPSSRLCDEKNPPNLFSQNEPMLFQTPQPKNVPKKQIARADLKYDRKRDVLGKVIILYLYVCC